jgi:WD40 repeat protein
MLIIAFLSLFLRSDVNSNTTRADITPLKALEFHSFIGDIDSNDQVIFDFDQITLDGDVIEVPVFIISDDMIFSLDFSMLLNLDSVEFESIVDHTEVLQYTAYVHDDHKLRFTSNDFSPYPLYPDKVVSIRFKVLHGVVHLSDFQMLVAYINGEGGCSSSIQLQGDEIWVSNKDIITNETFITPNPAGDFIAVVSDEEGVLEMFDAQGVAVIQNHHVHSTGSTKIDIHLLPRGLYTVRLMIEGHIVKTQRIVLQ